MAVLDSRADLAAEEYAANRERMEALVAELRRRTEQVAGERPPDTVDRHRSRGKLLARERIDRLLDPGSAFLELNALAAWAKTARLPASSACTVTPIRGDHAW